MMHTKAMPLAKLAFSFVELSIVLVILGLLAGGVLSGQSLIRAAEIRSVARDADRYRVAMLTFRDKYFALPGDMTNAVRFWGAAAGATADGIDAACVALDHTSPSTGTETCNGNGDGRIGSIYASERWRAVQQLANAGLIEGKYTGVTGAASSDQAVAGQNAIATRISNTAFLVVDFATQVAGGNWFAGDYNNTLIFGGTGTGSPSGPVLRPEEAWNIDTKIDDGKPAYGYVRTFTPNHPEATNCTTSVTAASTEYKLTDTSKACQLLMPQNSGS